MSHKADMVHKKSTILNSIDIDSVINECPTVDKGPLRHDAPEFVLSKHFDAKPL